MRSPCRSRQAITTRPKVGLTISAANYTQARISGRRAEVSVTRVSRRAEKVSARKACRAVCRLRPCPGGRLNLADRLSAQKAGEGGGLPSHLMPLRGPRGPADGVAAGVLFKMAMGGPAAVSIIVLALITAT